MFKTSYIIYYVIKKKVHFVFLFKILFYYIFGTPPAIAPTSFSPGFYGTDT